MANLHHLNELRLSSGSDSGEFVRHNQLLTSIFVPGNFPNNPKIKGIPMPTNGKSPNKI